MHTFYSVCVCVCVCVCFVYVWTKRESPRVAGAKASSWSKIMERQDEISIERVDVACDCTGQE